MCTALTHFSATRGHWKSVDFGVKIHWKTVIKLGL